MRKYLRVEITAIEKMKRLNGIYIDEFDGQPAARGPLSEAAVRVFCAENGMAFKQKYLTAIGIFYRALRRKEEGRLRRPMRRHIPAPPTPESEIVTVMKDNDGNEIDRMPFKEYVKSPPPGNYQVEHVTAKPMKMGRNGQLLMF